MAYLLSTSQIEDRISEIYSTAQICKQTCESLNFNLTSFLADLCQRRPGGRRRYSVETIGYAKGYSQALYHRIMREQVEFVYRDAEGNIFSTHKDTTHKRTTEEFYKACRGVELGEMEAAHVWKGTDKPFTPWSVPNQDMRDRAAAKAAEEAAEEGAPISVYFRVFEDDDDVIALWEEDAGQGMISSYMHVGQHGGADRALIETLRKASAEEKAPLLAELQGIGYTVTDADA